MRYLLTCALLLCGWGLSWGQGQVARLEYFIDTDPGLGQATAVGITPGAAISPSFVVPLATASQGFHTLYVRARDGQGRWSLTSQQAFYTTVLAPANQALTRAEYFIDQEPGLGSGTAIPLSAGQQSATLAFNVGLAAVSQGFHTLYLRTRDAQGAWSHTSQQAFYVLSQAAGSQALARAEYFIDQDPGQGLGTAVPLPAGQPAGRGTLAFNVPLASVSTGAHTLYLRVADKGGAWSLTQQQAFWVKPGGGLATIKAFRYAFAGTGSNAAYVSPDTLTYVVPTPAASVSLNFTADLSQLPGDANYDMRVWAVSSDGQKSLVQTKRVRVCTNRPVKAGLDWAQEGRQVFFVNASTNAIRHRWSFGDGTTDTTANPQHTYAAIGNYSVRLISSSFCNQDTATKVVSIRGLKDIATNHGGNTGTVSVVVTGAGFVPGMQLLLRRAGQADIVGDTAVALNLGTLAARFNLTGKPLGSWDVVANYPGGFAATIIGGFTIEPTVFPHLIATISGSNRLRAGFDQIHTITYQNSGNVDAYKVPLLIGGLPFGTTIKILSPLVNPDSVAGVDTLHLSTLLPRRTWDDSLNNTSFRAFFVSLIPAQHQGTLSVVFRVPATTPLGTIAHARVNIGSPASQFYVNPGTFVNTQSSMIDADVCLSELTEKAVVDVLNAKFPSVVGVLAQVTGAQPCIVGLAQRYYDNFLKPKRDASFLGPEQAKVLDASDADASRISLVSSCSRVGLTILGAAVSAYTRNPLFLQAALRANAFAFKAQEAYEEIYTNPVSYLSLSNKCLPLFVTAGRHLIDLAVVGASDPNAKYGLGAESFHHYVNKDNPLSYTISFENSPAASLNAQVVHVTDTLSAQAVDFNTFGFTSVTLGESTFNLSSPAKSFVHDFDFVAQHGVKARVIGTFDEATGLARWTILSIDPATNQATTNALAGFLPPNTSSPNGQGYVSFTVGANAARQTGDVIHNKAAIVFDYNAPIITNDWHNTFDLVRPGSAVTTLTTTPVDSVYSLSWAGADVGSGVQSYDIVYLTNGSNPRTWLAGTSATTALFTGRRNVAYQFYSVARDSAGNVEAAPLGPDVTTAAPLPVVLTAFTATPRPADVLLAWHTASERNSDYFEVQRSADAQAFQALGRVAAHGTTAQASAYAWPDTQPLPGLSYYRLRQVDLDKTFRYSPVVAVQRAALPAGITVYPNPTSSAGFRLRAVALPAGPATLLVADAYGRQLHEQALDLTQPDVAVRLPQPLAPGLYLVTVRTPAGTFTEKLLVQ